jgi:hypothetical protein
MPLSRKKALSCVKTLAFPGMLLAWHLAWAQSAAPPLIGEEMRHVRCGATSLTVVSEG